MIKAKNEHCGLIWLTIAPSESILIVDAISNGFEFYFCNKFELLLLKTLISDAIIPPAPTHFVGVGGIVIDDQNNLLVVKEKHEARSGFYKLPGGNLEDSEHFKEGIIREIKEETGVDTVFSSLTGVSQLKNWRLGKTNVYVICRLIPLTNSITMDPVELAECKWMPVQEYLDSPGVTLYNRNIVSSAIEGESKGLTLDSISEYLAELKDDGFQGEPNSFEMLSI
jgi:ADP-ribose pyrophosphatase YjhB (NUDIX family)